MGAERFVDRDLTGPEVSPSMDGGLVGNAMGGALPQGGDLSGYGGSIT